MIRYSLNEEISASEFTDILFRSGLSERRPVHKEEIIEKMIMNANLIVSARNTDNQLVGIARCMTDYAYCCYLSCLAVDKKHQGKGIGKKLVGRVLQEVGEESMLLLLSAPGTHEYYLNLGFEASTNAYIIGRGEKHQLALTKHQRSE